MYENELRRAARRNADARKQDRETVGALAVVRDEVGERLLGLAKGPNVLDVGAGADNEDKVARFRGAAADEKRARGLAPQRLVRHLGSSDR